MKKLISLAVTLLAIAAVSAPIVVHADAPAAPAQGTPVAKYTGAVTTIDTSKNQITINSKENGVHTFTITPSTAVTVAGTKADPSAIKVGMDADVQSTDGTTATNIDAKASSAGAAPAPAAPDAPAAPAAPAAPTAPAAPAAPTN